MTSERDAAAVRIFPPAVPLLTIVLGVVLNRLWPVTVGLRPPTSYRYVIGGLIVAGSIGGLGLWAVLVVRLSGQSENPWKPTPKIVDRGPFRISRNPMYLQMVLVCVGFAIARWNVWILTLTPLCAWALQRFAIAPEEAYLERKFGREYTEYKRRVRRWL